MRLSNLFLFALASAVFLTACDAFVSEIVDPIDRIPSESLNSPAQVPFLITGVEQRFNTVNGNNSVASSNLSDQFFFDTRVTNATFPTFRELNEGDILLDNNTVRNHWRQVGEYRLLADDLIDRTENRITFVAGQEALRQNALFNGYFHGALARYYMATFFGIDQNTGGGAIDESAFIPSAQLYSQALERFQLALGQTQDAYRIRLVNTLIARTHLFNGNFAAAQTAAQSGLVAGDAPYQSKYAPQSPNPWFSDGGRGRTQIVANDRFRQAFQAGDTRVPVEVAASTAATAGTFFRQALYIPNDAPINFASWQENNLMRAELALRLNGAAGAATALALINANRQAAGLAPIVGVADLALVERERDLQLFTQGLRLPDQRRFGTFHLPEGRWRFFPIPSDERNANPNL